ncbi:hypothetical protein CAPTEDRAFT_201848 [Capitella teleta]|uniref:Uncharacterized protein n=1 Tax=Capitella teleta TaxID=283909 RepID=R7UA91_CAPTE|nr:hypothetical protein CAPTEDRAFT_201848 [Capitella teleta]|eukprot:ELU03026.1 hypothetical protein CAPTEDRAFT_201848 [Capitella teleta]
MVVNNVLVRVFVPMPVEFRDAENPKQEEELYKTNQCTNLRTMLKEFLVNHVKERSGKRANIKAVTMTSCPNGPPPMLTEPQERIVERTFSGKPVTCEITWYAQDMKIACCDVPFNDVMSVLRNEKIMDDLKWNYVILKDIDITKDLDGCLDKRALLKN